MLSVVVWCSVVAVWVMGVRGKREEGAIEIIDLTHPANVQSLIDYYGAVEKRWKLCINCGMPGLGTTMHLEHETRSSQAVYPAVIPTEYLLARLVVINVSALVALQPALVLSLELALQWAALRHDPPEPTLLLFRFGADTPPSTRRTPLCVCKVPGISNELAEWIAGNLTRVVGVGTDAPTLESEETRQFAARSVAAILARSGIYMLENVNVPQRPALPERGCMAVAMPLKLDLANYVPSRLTAFCPDEGEGEGEGDGARARAGRAGARVVLALREGGEGGGVRLYPSRAHDVGLDDIMTH